MSAHPIEQLARPGDGVVGGQVVDGCFQLGQFTEGEATKLP